MAIPFNSSMIEGVSPMLRAILTFILAFFFINFILNLAKRALLRHAKTKKQLTNIQVFYKLLKYATIIIIIWIVTLSYSGSIAGLGLSIGLFAVIIAWTFMRPLLGAVAWLTIIIKRPFAIGDCIEISNVKGDVEDITLTHIYLRQTGGLVRSGEDPAGSLVIIPNAFFFEQPITNYTDRDNLVLQEVAFIIDYKSNVDRTISIAKNVARQVLEKEMPEYKREPFVITLFQEKCIGVHVRFYAPAQNAAKYVSDISYGILKKINRATHIRIISAPPK
jgi:small-conductance mechanosensitive channel